MNFPESVDYLLSLGNEVSAMKLGLENIRKLLDALGTPEKQYLKVQVAGTNGKGSVCAFLNSICLQAGIKTGMYTSPHLVSITERVQINGEDISETDFARLATHVRETAEKLLADNILEYCPTFFEQVTATALLAFAEAKVELAILETGLGGRLDATTSANAEIAAITQIDYDHQNYLGNTIEEIAAEKAAIIRETTRAVVAAHQHSKVERVISGRCREVGIEPIWATTNIVIKKDREIAPYLTATFVTEKENYSNILLFAMLGRHQFENAAVAIAMAEVLSDNGFDVSREAVMTGLENARHPGRLESIEGILLDGAHNIAGADALKQFLDENTEQPIVMIFGAMRDKDIRGIAGILFKKAETLILTQPANSRAFSAAEIAEATELVASENLILTETAAEALEAARTVAGREKQILVTGSLYLVGEVRKLLTR